MKNRSQRCVPNSNRTAFFRNIGYADELGSGTRNLYKYAKLYSGKELQIIEDDIFRMIVPLDDSYSFDMNTRYSNGTKWDIGPGMPSLTETESNVYMVICEGVATTRGEISADLGISDATVKRAIASLTRKGLIERIGSDTSGRWIKK